MQHFPATDFTLPAEVGPEAQQVRIFSGTWNCGLAGPPDDLSEWIKPDDCHIYSIATQVCTSVCVCV